MPVLLDDVLDEVLDVCASDVLEHLNDGAVDEVVAELVEGEERHDPAEEVVLGNVAVVVYVVDAYAMPEEPQTREG
eukprot:CAMPEP_0173418148 /NCGR_PEP_ID=MMETSP1357-20121228/373_1 /TAXON_ID=77926 /ORGANISM="Hemiselmis rufescens, Strain PCC563" /LENGTH=75 /DNA_ID=CAMNT_0014380589 /DNA_START=10 /DNA_END=237 /DNA_ORIENTATION=+